ncbi:hypothetical protein OG365_40195 (plasmid) [Streptomyces sp. NBC_00853]|uniref:hypothetical protein n=1 Tax=Streptomyces sp. NBC_00853 TaxID=2903681 RepID=UPI002F90C1A3|nr:hypothetical protein OG365_40195 [Streptomyces sp. NBC_00853]
MFWTQPGGTPPDLRGSPRSVRGCRAKIRHRDTTEAVIGAITCTLIRPQLLVLGRHDGAGGLRAVGRTVPLRPEQARQISEHLAPADAGHPWEGVGFASSWGSRDTLDTTLVRPDLVAEISADRAIDRGERLAGRRGRGTQGQNMDGAGRLGGLVGQVDRPAGGEKTGLADQDLGLPPVVARLHRAGIAVRWTAVEPCSGWISRQEGVSG